MADSSREYFECPSCARLFAWEPAYRGRQVKCSCGTVFNPEHPEAAAATPPAPAPSPPPARPSTRPAGRAAPRPRFSRVARSAPAADPQAKAHERMKAAAMAARAREARDHSAALTQAAGAFPTSHRSRAPEPAEEGGVITNFYLPVGLLIAGASIWLAQGAYSHADAGRGVLFNIAAVVVAMACNAAVMLTAMVASAYLLGVNYGTVGRVILKLTAMAVFCGAVFMAVAQLDAHSARGPILAWHVVVLIYWLLYSTLFDLDVQETVMSVAIVAIAQAVVAWIVMH